MVVLFDIRILVDVPHRKGVVAHVGIAHVVVVVVVVVVVNTIDDERVFLSVCVYGCDALI